MQVLNARQGGVGTRISLELAKTLILLELDTYHLEKGLQIGIFIFVLFDLMLYIHAKQLRSCRHGQLS